jgi:transposase
MRYQLSDFEWTAIKPMLPDKLRGVPRVNDRRVLNGIFWVLRSGAPWRALPENYGPCTTCYNRFIRRRQAGVATRYDKLAANYLAFIKLAAIRILLRRAQRNSTSASTTSSACPGQNSTASAMPSALKARPASSVNPVPKRALKCGATGLARLWHGSGNGAQWGGARSQIGFSNVCRNRREYNSFSTTRQSRFEKSVALSAIPFDGQIIPLNQRHERIPKD